ncbi:unnamed protein product [Linum trigynum]|uniref:RNase H type-1 domain-containing protein n=1 Tax=Linum trigynum TaxID=586398 RepID=A0AAV2D4L1_9ROSI
MVILTPAREILLAQGVQFEGLDDPMVAELLTLREGVSWVRGLGFMEMRFEGDAKVVIEKILRRDTRDNQVGAILEEVIHLLGLNPGFSLRFVGRRNNRVAHVVARKALSLFSTASRSFDFQIWLSSRM